MSCQSDGSVHRFGDKRVSCQSDGSVHSSEINVCYVRVTDLLFMPVQGSSRLGSYAVGFLLEKGCLCGQL